MNELRAIIGYTDKLKMLRALMKYPLSDWVRRYFDRTRSFETQLYFVEYCRGVIRYHRAEIGDEEYAEFDIWLIRYELDAYDRLNMWGEYIWLFEKTLRETCYFDIYGAERNDPTLNSYIMGQSGCYKHVHFLYACDNRYRVIQRKHERSGDDKKVAHLKRHQQDQLSKEEVNVRHEELKRLFESMSEAYSTL
jgi:hypothetical protein